MACRCPTRARRASVSGTMADRDEIVRYLDETLEAALYRDHLPLGLQVPGGRRGAARLHGRLRVARRVRARRGGRRADADRPPRPVLGRLAAPDRACSSGGGSRRCSATTCRWSPTTCRSTGTTSSATTRCSRRCSASSRWSRSATTAAACSAATGRSRRPSRRRRWRHGSARRIGSPPLVFARRPRPGAERRRHLRRRGARRSRAAAALGLDCFITGEPEEDSPYLAAELGVTLIAAGHNATETVGVQAVGDRLVREIRRHDGIPRRSRTPSGSRSCHDRCRRPVPVVRFSTWNRKVIGTERRGYAHLRSSGFPRPTGSMSAVGFVFQGLFSKAPASRRARRWRIT